MIITDPKSQPNDAWREEHELVNFVVTRIEHMLQKYPGMVDLENVLSSIMADYLKDTKDPMRFFKKVTSLAYQKHKMIRDMAKSKVH